MLTLSKSISLLEKFLVFGLCNLIGWGFVISISLGFLEDRGFLNQRLNSYPHEGFNLLVTDVTGGRTYEVNGLEGSTIELYAIRCGAFELNRLASKEGSLEEKLDRCPNLEVVQTTLPVNTDVRVVVNQNNGSDATVALQLYSIDGFQLEYTSPDWPMWLLLVGTGWCLVVVAMAAGLNFFVLNLLK